MKVFVTGATGWIGSAVVDDLLDKGHEPVCLARTEEKSGNSPRERSGCGARRIERS